MKTNGQEIELVETEAAPTIELAELDQSTTIALRHPRSVESFIKKLQMYTCFDETTAANCIYSLPRGNKPIIGPNINFAVMAASAWRNGHHDARVHHVDRHEGVVEAVGYYQDYEDNNKTTVRVTSRIVGRNGRLFSDDMIALTGMAAASKARRNAILMTIPRPFWQPIYENCVNKVRGDAQTFVERKDRAIKAFANFGVKPEQVVGALGLHSEADLTLDHIVPLRGMYQALRDGVSTVEEMFDPRRMTGGFEGVVNPLADPKEEHDKETGELPHKKRGRPYGSHNKPKAPPEPVEPLKVGGINPSSITYESHNQGREGMNTTTEPPSRSEPFPEQEPPYEEEWIGEGS